MDDVVAQYGDRVPALEQTAYRIGWVVVSDRALTAAEFAFEEFKSTYYASGTADALLPGPDRTSPPLPYATKGLATFDTTLPPIP